MDSNEGNILNDNLNNTDYKKLEYNDLDMILWQ